MLGDFLSFKQLFPVNCILSSNTTSRTHPGKQPWQHQGCFSYFAATYSTDSLPTSGSLTQDHSQAATPVLR